jgi:putative nucleotidyltransferase with HDIG domain
MESNEMKPRQPAPRSSSRQNFLSVVLLVCVSILAFIALIQPWSLRQATLPLQAGDVSPQDLRALSDLQYVSQIKTEEARTAAERAVDPIYAPADPVIARGQLEKSSSILSYITSVRLDTYATPDQKKADLAALEGINLQSKDIEYLLAISSTRWDTIQSEALNVLEQVMRNPIRTDDLESVRQNLPSMVSFTLTEEETALVIALASPLVAANSFYSPELTQAARQAARDAVPQVTQSYVKGQSIVSSGQVISAADFEALTELGLIRPGDRTIEYIGAGALVLLAAAFTVMYFYRRQSPVLSDLRGLILLALLFLLFLAGARVVLPNRTVAPYLYPLPAFGLLVSALFGMESGMVFSLLLSALSAYGMPDALGLLPYYILGSFCGILVLGHARRVGNFLGAGAAIAGASTAMLVAYRLPFTTTDWIGVATLVGAAVFTGVASTSIALPAQYLLAQFLGLTTALQLLEISRPDFPLLKYFLQRAPGTYQHSLQVANLAEQAAERIHADGLLTRVGAIFHDIGKSANPLFFVENQPPDQIDAHENLEPALSAETIIRHVTDGLELAKKYRLPRRIHDFISEHHGTLIARYQYNAALSREVRGALSREVRGALEAAGGHSDQVDIEKFRYPGPPPRSRETALLMLADGVEARVRAEHPKNDDELRAIVRSVIENRQQAGQLENTSLTQRDLQDVTESFITTLRGTYHPRLEYPQERPPAGEMSTSPVVRTAKKSK